MIFRRAVAKLRGQDWVAITIELVIVTAGVLIALAAQQWAEERAWSNKVRAGKAALRDGLRSTMDTPWSFASFTHV